jgi:hypothetical protein
VKVIALKLNPGLKYDTTGRKHGSAIAFRTGRLLESQFLAAHLSKAIY